MENPPDSPVARRRVPAFTPVPLRYRADGWTPMRQANFLGALAETWSATEAAARVGMSRESAYRLRAKPGADSFAAAWDVILMQREEASRKVTNKELVHRARHGRLKPILYRGRHVGVQESPDNQAVLELYRRVLREGESLLRRQERGRQSFSGKGHS